MPFRILLIDDDYITRLLISVILKEVGHEVIEAENASIGISIAQEMMPDAIICDFKMPGISGQQALQAIREFYNGLFFFLTGNLNSIDQDNAIRLGANGYFVKPVEEQYFLKRITSELERIHNNK